jgi:hypothetical protein
LTHFTAPYTGNIVEKGTDIPEEDIDTIRRIEALVSREDPAAFSFSHVLSFARDRAPTPLFQDLADLAARINLQTVHPNDVPGMVNVYLESRAFEDPLAAAFDSFRKTVDSLLLPAIHLTDRGYYLIGPDGEADVKASLEAGAVLKKLAVYENNELYYTIGNALVASALLLAETEGLLPARINTDERTVIGTSGTLYPEAVYPIIAGDRYYPKHVSLTAGPDARTWAWTSAEKMSAVRSGSLLTISFEYPVGATHHFVLHGIEPFSFMTFFGIRWVSDPQFQIYSSGWLYDETSKTLYVKITHSRVGETLILSYE